MTAAETVDRLIQDMKRAAINRDMGKFEQKSDELAVLVRAYAEPLIESPWPYRLFTKHQARIVNILFTRLGKPTSHEAIINALYFDHPNGGPECPLGIIKIQISYIRKKLEGTGYHIKTHWGDGFEMRLGEGEHRTTFLQMSGANRHRPVALAA